MCGGQLAKVNLTKYLYHKNVSLGLYQIRLYKLEILKINDIFTLQIAKFIYKSLIGDTPENFHEWFKLNCDSHSYNTRSNYTDINNIVKSNNIFIRSTRTSFYGLKLIKVDGPKMWNSLPNSLRNINSLKKFVKCLKDYLIQKYI